VPRDRAKLRCIPYLAMVMGHHRPESSKGFCGNADAKLWNVSSRNARIKTAIAFSDCQRAIEFEEYLKSPTGRAFSKKIL